LSTTPSATILFILTAAAPSSLYSLSLHDALPISDSDRSLGTVVFTDMVQSTNRAAEIGDGRWHDLLESHNRLVRRQLERFGGRLDRKSTRLNSSHEWISYAVFCLKKKRKEKQISW